MIAIISHFSYLAAIFWMNSTCIDVWLTFRKVQQRRQPEGIKVWQRKEFKYYLLWAYLLPILISSLTLIMDAFFEDQDSFLHPGLATENCYLSHDGHLIYQIIPMVPVLLSNLVLFGLTAWNLTFGSFSVDAISKQSMNLRVKAIGKIFLVTGTSWIAEAISLLAIHFTNDVNNSFILKVAFPFDLFNALIGLSLFLAIGPSFKNLTFSCKIIRFSETYNFHGSRKTSITDDFKNTFKMKSIDHDLDD